MQNIEWRREKRYRLDIPQIDAADDKPADRYWGEKSFKNEALIVCLKFIR